MAPFFSRSGYGTEAIAFVKGLEQLAPQAVTIRQHGDVVDNKVFRGFSKQDQHFFRGLYTREMSSPTISICHSEPGAWHPANYETLRCPEPNSVFAVGRTMFETDRLPKGWMERCNRMGHVWVPSKFHYDVFAAGGVHPEKLFVVPEAVDVDFYDPALYTPLDLSKVNVAIESPAFKFLSIFKWEERKGWKILVEAFAREFIATDGVHLIILTHGYHGSIDTLSPKDQIRAYLHEHGVDGDIVDNIHVIDVHVKTHELPQLYLACDCFVLPSRGEGWGRPHVEAMSMGIPIIATNWSGPTEYMTEANSFPLRVEDELVLVGGDGPFASHKWAEPSLSHLRELMRFAAENIEITREKGRRARADMIEKYRPETVAQIVLDLLRLIEAQLLRDPTQSFASVPGKTVELEREL